jgi:pimeloyl-ACP methyl ester carboxylesterase
MVPSQLNGKAVLYLHPDGKAAEGGTGGEIEWFVQQGYTVLAPDLIGTGEAGPGDSAGTKDFFHRVNTGVSYRTWYAGMFIGRSILGVRAADVVKLAAILKARSSGTVIAVARGAMGPVLLHAAAFTPDIGRIAVLESPVSYRSLVATQMYSTPYIETFVPGVLRSYDLPHLVGTLAPRRVIVHNSVDGSAQPLTEKAAHEDYAPSVAAYEARRAVDRFSVSIGDDPQKPLTLLLRD